MPLFIYPWARRVLGGRPREERREEKGEEDWKRELLSMFPSLKRFLESPNPRREPEEPLLYGDYVVDTVSGKAYRRRENGRLEEVEKIEWGEEEKEEKKEG